MIKELVIVGVSLVPTGCTEIENYNDIVKTPVSAGLEGYWQSKGPQRSPTSLKAIASLVITKEGNMPDYHQWQQVIALLGKLTMLFGDLTNMTMKRELYETEREGNTLEYDNMMLRQVDHPTQEYADTLRKTPLATPLP